MVGDNCGTLDLAAFLLLGIAQVIRLPCGGLTTLWGLCRFVWNGRRPTCGAAQAWPPRAVALRALKALSRAGEARRSGPFTAPETLVSSRAWGWLRFSAASPRARPAARTSPPSGAGSGVGAPEGLGTGIGPVPHETTQTQFVLSQCCGFKLCIRESIVSAMVTVITMTF